MRIASGSSACMVSVNVMKTLKLRRVIRHRKLRRFLVTIALVMTSSHVLFT